MKQNKNLHTLKTELCFALWLSLGFFQSLTNTHASTHSSFSVRETPTVSCLVRFCWCFAFMVLVLCKEFNKAQNKSETCFRICCIDLKILDISFERDSPKRHHLETSGLLHLTEIHFIFLPSMWRVMGAVTVLYFVFSFGPALNEAKGEGPQRKCTDNPQMAPSRVGSVQARGNICDVTWPGRTIKGVTSDNSPSLCRSLVIGLRAVSKRSSADVGRTCCWRGEQKVTVWSVTTTEQTGHFEQPPPRHRPQKEAFKWHLFHFVALSRFKSVGSPERIDILPADWSLKATEVKGEQGARWPGVGTTQQGVYSLLCSRQECYQPPLQPPSVDTGS